MATIARHIARVGRPGIGLRRRAEAELERDELKGNWTTFMEMCVPP